MYSTNVCCTSSDDTRINTAVTDLGVTGECLNIMKENLCAEWYGHKYIYYGSLIRRTLLNNFHALQQNYIQKTKNIEISFIFSFINNLISLINSLLYTSDPWAIHLFGKGFYSVKRLRFPFLEILYLKRRLLNLKP
jgi:hypothetical protein